MLPYPGHNNSDPPSPPTPPSPRPIPPRPRYGVHLPPLQPANLPPLGAGVLVATVGVCGTLAVSFGHVDLSEGLPPISMTGMDAPEASVFSGGMTVMACLLFVAAYLLRTLISAAHDERVRRGLPRLALPCCGELGTWNTVLYGVSLAAVFFLAVLGNLSLRDAFWIHQAAAGLFFYCAFAQAWIATFLLHRIYPAPLRSPSVASSLRWKKRLVIAIGVTLIPLRVAGSIGLALLYPHSDAAALSFGSITQYLLVSLLAAFVFTFRSEFNAATFVLTLAPPHFPDDHPRNPHPHDSDDGIMEPLV